MSNRYIITRTQIREQEYLVYSVFDEKLRMMELSCEKAGSASLLGNLYIGRVKDIVPNLNAAFIEIGAGITCYYSMEDYRQPLFTRKIGKKPLCCGDELVVQVTKEAVKTKFPVVTTNLNFAGKYLVLTTENTSIGVSSKLPKDTRRELRELFQTIRQKEASAFGVILRTNAGSASANDLENEYHQLTEEYLQLKAVCVHKTAFTCLKQSKPFYLKELEGINLQPEDEVITDLEEVHEELSACSLPADPGQLRLYQDPSYPLNKRYNISSGIQEALRERVWLKSGAYLIISPTEALTVIDVNSGKNVSGKHAQENFLKINKEAAVEIARQLRLRNISGICVVDFINLTSDAAVRDLMHTFRMALKQDRIPTNLIDITKLGLVELTRKKVRGSLAEQIKNTP